MSVAEQVIAESIDYLVAHFEERPDLAFLARRAGYETTYFQKLFSEKVGVSPKRLLQYMSMRRAGALLQDGETIPGAACGAGLSGTGRLHDLFVTCLGVTPGEARFRGLGVSVSYGYHPTPLGEILVGRTERGVCYLGFLVDENRTVPFERMKAHLPFASFVRDQEGTCLTAAAIMDIWGGRDAAEGALRLELHGTNLQIHVWQALLRIPAGETSVYGTLAAQLGRPRAARAVGNAVGANPVSLLIPCHRVILASGIIDNYGWGSARKKLILGMEGGL